MKYELISPLTGQQLLFAAALGVFVLLCALMALAYYRCLRPRRGTTEWMKRLDAPHFAPVKRQKLRWFDSLWMLLSALCAAVARFAYLVILLGLYRDAEPLTRFFSHGELFLRNLSAAGILGATLYAILRLTFARPLPAVCLSALSGLVLLPGYNKAFIMLTVSLLLLWLWMCGSLEQPCRLFPNALYLLVSGLSYAMLLVICWPGAWLIPFYLFCYIAVLVVRYRHADKEKRTRQLVLSVLLVALCLVLGAVALYLLYTLRQSGDVEGFWLSLRSFELPGQLMATLRQKFADLFVRRSSLTGSLRRSGVFLLLAGAVSLLPMCHGAFRLRRSECLWALGLLVLPLCLWLVTGYYLLALPLLLALGWQWSVLTQRGRGALVLVQTLLIAGASLVTNIL